MSLNSSKKENHYTHFHHICDNDFNITIDPQKEFKLFNTINTEQVSLFNISFDIFCFTTRYIVLPLTLLFIVLLFLNIVYSKLFSKKLKSSFNAITSLIINMLSYYEFIVITTSFFFLIVIKLVLALSEDDSSDMVPVVILFFIIILIISFYVSMGTIKSYYLLNSNSSGEIKKRLIFNEVVNTFLCLLRIFLCLTRYIFYDLQVELVDMVLNYTEDINYVCSKEIDNLSFLDILFSKVFDIFIIILSISICLIKFSISLFLL